MESTEVEEGEAPGYPDGDTDSTIDPDVAFSYIGEKVQQYLGHHQKDFEGAKFNWYGSFLPTYQCSSSSSQIKSTERIDNYNCPSSNLNSEDQRSHDASEKPFLLGHFSKGKGCLQSNHIEEPILKSEAFENPVNPSDRRTLKVRIKVGCESSLTQKNADLYSGLGLVVSPSTSLDGSPTIVVKKCSKRLREPDESPTSILEVMTSVPRELPISPLPEDLIHLTEKGNFGIKRKAECVDKTGIECSGTLGDGIRCCKGSQRVLELKRVKSYEKDDSFSTELGNQKNNIDQNGSQHNITDPAKDAPVAAAPPLNVLKDGAKAEFLSSQEYGRFQKCGARMGPSINVSKSIKANIISGVAVSPQEYALKAENSNDLDHFQSSSSEGRKALHSSGDTKSSKQLVKTEPVNEGLKLIREKSSMGSKRKQKVNQTVGTQGVCMEKDESSVQSSLPQKGGINHRTNDSLIHTEPISNSGQCHPDLGNPVDELSHQKENKPRVSKSDEKEFGGRKTNGGTNSKSKERKDQHNGQYPSKTQALDSLKGDTGSEQPLLLVNSSSFKLSDSYKSTNSGKETKGSSVESVSSSPLKGPNAHKLSSTRKKLDGKDNFHDSGFTAIDSSRRIPGDKGDGRIEQIETVKEDKTIAVNNHVTSGDTDQPCQINTSFIVKQCFDKCNIEKSYASQSQKRGFPVKKSGKELSSHSKDMVSTSVSDMDKSNFEDELDERKRKSDENSGNSSKDEKIVSQKGSAGGTSIEVGRGQDKRKSGHDNLETENNRDKKSNLENENAKLSIYANGKSSALPPLARCQTETVSNLQPNSGSCEENSVKGTKNGDMPKAQNQRKRTESQNGQAKRHPTPNSQKPQDGEAPSPLQRDSSSHAANNALKEAKDLKHLADRFKNSGSTERTGIYFQSALKFLHGASLLESGCSKASKHGELTQSMDIYSSTAKLCEFCAREYEKSNDMAAAALAYKCMEVAYLRVVYSSQTSVIRDRTALQAALQITPSGESPSSSASDIDNHQVTADKAPLAKAADGSSRNHSVLSRIIHYAQDVNAAMEASWKSRNAFAAATSTLGATSKSDGTSSLERALNFNFLDIESLLRLVRVAMETIGH